MEPYLIGVDVWEGSLDIDESVLHNAGVSCIVIRLNDMNGGHHMDENFHNQWAQAKNFYRWPYFVYNPWVSGRENYNWLESHIPHDATHVMLDIEVRKADYPPEKYASEVATFWELCKRAWSCDIYTGMWFLPYLSKWPSDARYTWARYPYSWYPEKTTYMTWEEIHRKAQAAVWDPGGGAKLPGSCKMWQITADRYILPGCAGRVIDILLFNGAEKELEQYIGYRPPATGNQDAEKVLRAIESNMAELSKNLADLRAALSK